MEDPAETLPEMDRPPGSRPVVDADYRRMVETVVDYAIFLIDANGAVRSWNDGARRLKQYEFHEVEGRHFSIFYPQELVDRQWPRHELAEARRHGRFEDEGWRVRKDGSRFWANIIITRLLGADGSLRGFTKITRDITERRSQEELLRRSEERFRLLVENVKDYAIFMLDPAGHVASWNPGAEMNTGYKASEIVGRHFSIFYPEDQIAVGAPARELTGALRDGRYEDQGWRIRKDGSRLWVAVVLTPAFDETGRHRGFAKVTRDMSASRRIADLETEGRRMNAYLAMLGHELRNPLAPVVNAVALMKQVPIESEVVRSARDVVDRQVRQMTRLVDDLLDVSRISSGKIRLQSKAVSLDDVVAQAVEAALPLMQDKNHRLHVSAESGAWVSGDSTRLVQIVTNLLNNAAKFTPGSGEIQLSAVRTGDAAEIRVRDNGLGVRDELQSQIFEMFSQGEQDLSRHQGGLGVGLSLCRQLVSLHGGSIRVFSTGVAGEGSEFVVTLPRIAEPVAQPARNPAAGKKVVVVDDNADAANMLALLVRSMGYETAVAYDGLAAVELILRTSPDAVLLDIGLPGLDGRAVARQVHAGMSDPPRLVAITGYGQDADRDASLEVGFRVHLTKPVQFDQIEQLLRKLLG